jgi:hypothetical protein
MSKTPMEIMLDNIDFKPVSKPETASHLPYVTHEGELAIGDITITVLVLSNGMRIIPEDEIKKIFPDTP